MKQQIIERYKIAIEKQLMRYQAAEEKLKEFEAKQLVMLREELRFIMENFQ